ncbi:MAG: hypothetical protein ACW9W4_07825 [Candidatus Nitrosopumilus sp. bin_7KS]
MSLEKILKGIDIYLEGKKQLVSGLENEIKFWSDDKISSLTSALIDSLQTDVQFLEVLQQKLLFQNNLKSNCKHPKKMRDRDPEGIWYCMNCNANL